MVTKRMKGAERRRQILGVARRLFARRGFSQTTTAAIAEAAGVTEPILYRHFKGKNELFLHLLEEVSEQLIWRLRSVAEAVDDPREQLAAMVGQYPELAAEFDESFVMINRALASLSGNDRSAGLPNVRPVLAGYFEAFEKLVGEILDRGQKAGIFRSDVDVHVMGWHLIHAAIGWRMAGALGLELFGRSHFVPQAARVLLEGLFRK